MAYRSYIVSLSVRVLGLLAVLIVLAYGIVKPHAYLTFFGALGTLIIVINLYHYVVKRFVEMDDFFESIKYRDFSRWFSEEHGPNDIRQLHKGFNLVNKTIKSINNERQAQFVYLQKILEMVNVGIVAYNVESGEVLWTNDSFLKILDFPSFKNIRFVESRRPAVYQELFETYHSNTVSVTLQLKQEALKVLISDTVFDVADESFKLVVVQNIDDTLNRNESEAWKKLLSVMTHEIMNSIAPISSLAETLEENIDASIQNPESGSLELEDIHAGINSIKKRSEGLMKFAKTYRSLNKVTKVNRSKITANELFGNINDLLRPTIVERRIEINFVIEKTQLELEIDTYLIEQVLINLIMNAMDAVEGGVQPKIIVSAEITPQHRVQLTVSDNGKGIPMEVQESVFIPFFTTKATGSGIGLSLCKQIMTLHQGKIQLKSREGVGTEVRLLF